MKKFQYLRIILAKISIFFCFCFSETCWHVFNMDSVDIFLDLNVDTALFLKKLATVV